MNEVARQAADRAVAQLLGPGAVAWTTDACGNAFGWARLCSPASLAALAPLLAGAGARLMTVTAYRKDKFARLEGREISYHFDLDGVVLTVAVCLPEGPPRVPSITPWFQNADWNEREFAELYGIELEGHPNMRRLFVDPALDGGVLDRLVPLSAMMNGASTTTLWEKVFAGRELPAWAKAEAKGEPN